MPGSTRDRLAAALFGLLAAFLLGLAAAEASALATFMGGVLAAAAIAALRGFPIDREW